MAVRGLSTVAGAALLLVMLAAIGVVALTLLGRIGEEGLSAIHMVREAARPDVDAVLTWHNLAACGVSLPSDLMPRYVIYAEPGSEPVYYAYNGTVVRCPSRPGVTNVTFVGLDGRVARLRIAVLDGDAVAANSRVETPTTVVYIGEVNDTAAFPVYLSVVNRLDAYWPIRAVVVSASSSDSDLVCNVTELGEYYVVQPLSQGIAKAGVVTCTAVGPVDFATVSLSVEVEQPGNNSVRLSAPNAVLVVNASALGAYINRSVPGLAGMCNVDPPPVALIGYTWQSFDRPVVSGLEVALRYGGDSPTTFTWSLNYSASGYSQAGTVTLQPGQQTYLLDVSFSLGVDVPEDGLMLLVLNSSDVVCVFPIRAPRAVTFELVKDVVFDNGTLVIWLRNVGLGSGTLVSASIRGLGTVQLSQRVLPGDLVKISFDGAATSTQYTLDLVVDHDDFATEAQPDQSISFQTDDVPWISGFNCRVPITVEELSGNDLFDYTVKVVIRDPEVLSASNGTDLLFVRYGTAGPIFLNHWVERWGAGEAVVWVKLDSLPANSNETVYMYFCNPNWQDRSSLVSVISVNDPAWNGAYRYEVWDTGVNAFEGIVGVSLGQVMDDESIRYTLPTQIPFYDLTVDTIYIDSNGRIGMGVDYGSLRYSSLDLLLITRSVAAAWANLIIDGFYYDVDGDGSAEPIYCINSGGIYVDDNYLDSSPIRELNGLQGVAIYWDARFWGGQILLCIFGFCLATCPGPVQFETILYYNGIIRIDFGTIYTGDLETIGAALSDTTMVVGISSGDENMYTVYGSGAHGIDPSYLNNHTTLVFWPRKYVEPEPLVTVGGLETATP